MPAPRLQATITAEADRLELAMNSLRQKLSVEQEIAVWDTWQDHGLTAAEHVLTAIKEARSPQLMRQKAAAPLDDFDRFGAQFAEAGRAAAMSPGASKSAVLKHMQACVAQLAPAAGGRQTVTDSGDQSVVRKETAKPAPGSGEQLKAMMNSAAEQMRREGGYY